MKTRARHLLLAASLAAAVLKRPLQRARILAHGAALRGIAAVNEGTRVSGTEGYDDSADYVARKAERAGLTVTRQQFTYRYGDADAGAFLGDISSHAWRRGAQAASSATTPASPVATSARPSTPAAAT